MLKRICIEFGYKIVVSSTWRKFGKDHVSASLTAHDLWKYAHDDWCTKDLWERGGSGGSRPDEIADWIERNGCEDYVILDDDSFLWTPEQRARWIKTDTLNGLSTEDYENFIGRNRK